eukprot:15480484-Alexandrium_andersonii.AAC.1
MVLEAQLVERRQVVGLSDARHRVGLQLHDRHVALDLRRLAADHPEDDAERPDHPAQERHPLGRAELAAD